MNANMPIIQLPGSAAGAINTASPAAAASGGTSQFSAMMSSILGNSAGDVSSMPSAISSESNVSTLSVLSSEQFQEISARLLSALNGQGEGQGLASLAGELAALLSELGGGKLVPLGAGIDLIKLAEAGVELPEGLEEMLDGGQAMLLVDQDALKALLSGGGWKEGMTVPALLMAGSNVDGQPGVALLQTELTAVQAESAGTGNKTLQFQLTFDQNTTINIISGSDAPVVSAPETPAYDSLAAALAWLKAVAEGKDPAGTEETSETDTDGKAASASFLLGGGETTGVSESEESEESDSPLTLSDVEDSEAAEKTPYTPTTEAGEDAEKEAKELAEKINDLISALLNTTSRQHAGADPVSTVDRVAAALELLAGQVASSGNSEAAGRALELMSKLGKLSSMGEGEQQKVLSELASSLQNLLSSLEGEEGDAARTATSATTPAAGAGNIASDQPALTDELKPAAGTTVKDSQAETVKVVAGSESQETARPVDTNTEQKTEKPAGQPAAQSLTTEPDSAQALRDAIETVAAAAGAQAADDNDENSKKSDKAQRGSELVNRIAGTIQQTTGAQPQMKASAETSAETKPASVSAAPATQPQTQGETQAKAAAPVDGAEAKPADSQAAHEARQKSADKVQEADSKETKQVQDVKTARAESLAAAAATDSGGQKVTVPVELSSVNKKNKTQSKANAASAISAFSSNSSSASRASGQSNNLADALRNSGGEEAVKDMLEALVTEKKGEGKDAGQLVVNRSDQQTDGIISNSSARGQELTGRVQNLRAESQQQTSQADLAKQAETFEKIINTARLIKAGATTELNMKLNPDHLGMMRVRMSVDDNKVMHATIQVETQEARSMIESNLHRLRDSLAEQGIKVEKFSVDVRQDQHQQSQQQSAGAGREGQWQGSGQGTGGQGHGGASGAGLAGVVDDVDSGAQTIRNKYDYSTLEWVA